MTIQQRSDIDILIVGAGPVGLFLASECARRGLRWRLVEAHASQSVHSKALAIFPRTLEVLDMAGLVDPFLGVANRVASVGIVSHGRRLARLRFAPDNSPYPFIAMVPQNVTERLLARQLEEAGGKIEYNTALVSAVDRGSYVAATLDRHGERVDVTAAFVVGCDGAHSTVRHLLNLPFAGGEYEDSFMLADVETNDALPADELLLCPSESGPVAIFPMSATRRRIVAIAPRIEGDAPSLDLVREILAQRAPAEIEALALNWSSYFRVHHRRAARLRVGRMFIAGDAAHIHSPYGGQGMNTGLQDAWNLAWKLDFVVRGHGNEQLLDSYNAERIPVIDHVIQTTHTLTKVMSTPSVWAQRLRDVVIPMVSHLAPFQHAFVERLSELGIAYRGSPIVDGLGTRFFDQSLRGGKGIVRRFLLFSGDSLDESTQSVLRQLIASSNDVLELRLKPGPGLQLVRPDGYLAYSSSETDGASLNAVRELLDRQLATRVVAA
jgi:2-polyprenyl-6-methoxyphenol hydroxylase-like FAD-dependent oxidoreductase